MRKTLQKILATLRSTLTLTLVALGMGMELGVGIASATAASPAPVTPTGTGAGTPVPSEPNTHEAQVAQAAQTELNPSPDASADKLRHLISTHFDLRKNDEVNKGRAFTMERHVAKSFESLEISLERQQRNSSWQPQRRIKSSYVSLEIAEEVVKQALLANVDKIQAWLNSDAAVATGEPELDKRAKDQGQVLGHDKRDEDGNPKNTKSNKDENKRPNLGKSGKSGKKDGRSRRESYLRLKYKMPNEKIGYGIIQSSKDQVPKLLRYESEKAVVVISKDVGIDAALPFFVVTSYPVQK